jgi:glycine hydroxymethyltransferase
MIMVTELGLKKNPDLGKKINSAIIPGIQGGPHLNSIAALAVALKEASTAKFNVYGKQIVTNAVALADEMKKKGFKLVTDGTDSHLILADMTPFGLLGNTMAEGCEAAGIVLNRNGVPFDPNPPFYPSGIRLGTPGITSRGMKAKEMKIIAGWLSEIADDLSKIAHKQNQTSLAQKDPEIRAGIIKKSLVLKQINRAVKAMCKAFPIPDLYV